MINKAIQHTFSEEQTRMCTFHHVQDVVKTQLMDEVVKEIVPGKDYLFRLDTQTEHFPITDEVVYRVLCKAEEVDETPIFSRRFIVPKQFYCPWPRDVIFNAPATIVFWDDGSKTVVKLMEGEEFNPEVGLAMCFCKKVMGDGYKRWFKDALKKGRMRAILEYVARGRKKGR